MFCRRIVAVVIALKLSNVRDLFQIRARESTRRYALYKEDIWGKGITPKFNHRYRIPGEHIGRPILRKIVKLKPYHEALP